MEKEMSYYFEEEVLVINRELTQLDNFLEDFLKILIKYSEYLVVSGFVSISTGRSRGTEDIDVLVKLMDEDTFKIIFDDIIDNGFWCYQSDNPKEAYKYIKNFNSIRFSKKDTIYPNIEFIPINEFKRAKWFEFTHPQKIRVQDFNFKIPPLEFEILYKEILLASKKDMEDARHLRVLFSDILKKERFKEYEPIIKGELK